MPAPSSIGPLHAAFCMFCTVLASVFLLASYLFNKSPIAKQKSRCYNKDKKKHFQSPFHFLISLFSWTPRARLAIDPGALHCGDAPTGNSCTAGLYSLHHWVPLGVVTLCDSGDLHPGESPLTIRVRCAASYYCPYPHCIVTAIYTAPKHFYILALKRCG